MRVSAVVENKLKVLAVDDNSISLAAIEQELKDEYEVIPLNSGMRALQYLKKEIPDLILMDIQMEEKNGIETLKEIRDMEECKDIPVIMLTSMRDKEMVVESAKLKVEDYVIKPFNKLDLHERVDRVLKWK
ncbi:MAG: response regulator [Lachnospiraceae bacterium]|nr:response regulator [Lachnospiraceae bacterium]